MAKEVRLIPVDKSTDFVGLKINENNVELYVPRVFREEEENIKRDRLLFLKSLALAKTFDKQELKNGNDVNDNVWPIDSYLWIILDFLDNGYYYNRDKVYARSNSGKIDWKRTLKQTPIYSDGNIIYDKMIISKITATNDIVAQTYRLCLKQSIDRIGWLFEYEFYVEIQQRFSIPEMINAIRNELNQTFDDIKKLRYNHLLKILKCTEGNKMISSVCSYGITNYYYVFETMVDSLFDGISINKSKYNPSGHWHLNGGIDGEASKLRPDTILKRNNNTYILDAKMYQYGCTHDINDLPDTQSLQKQITYGDFVHNSIGDENIRNAFILPYNKDLGVFKNDSNLLRYSNDNLVYFGYADVDWRDDKVAQDYDYIYTFGIDFNYLLRNYRIADFDIITKLCTSIEDKIKLFHLEEHNNSSNHNVSSVL